MWYQNAWHTSKVTGTSFWYQKLGAENLGLVPWPNLSLSERFIFVGNLLPKTPFLGLEFFHLGYLEAKLKS